MGILSDFFIDLEHSRIEKGSCARLTAKSNLQAITTDLSFEEMQHLGRELQNIINAVLVLKKNMNNGETETMSGYQPLIGHLELSFTKNDEITVTAIKD